jgi:hypothetical protein
MEPLLSSFDRQFSLIDKRPRELLSRINDDQLFARSPGVSDSLGPASCGEYILRSAAMVEKTFGGITTRLWDDPFEWTLPEGLGTNAAVLKYLDEVEDTRRKGFAFFKSDDELGRQMPAPEKLLSLHDILLETIANASHYQGRAFAVFQLLTGAKPPRL